MMLAFLTECTSVCGAADLTVHQGATSRYIQFFIQDTSQSVIAGLSGLTSSSSGLAAYYIREGDATATAITLAAGTIGTWVTSGFVEVDSVHMKGEYQLGIPNAALSAGKWCKIYVYGAANCSPRELTVELTQTDNQDGVHGGMTALPNAAAAASNGLITIGTGSGQLNPNGSGGLAGLTSMLTGTATAGSNANPYTITLASATQGAVTYATSVLQGDYVFITGGTGAGQTRTITAWNSGTLVLTTGRAWSVTPDATSTYVVIGNPHPVVDANLAVTTGTVATGIIAADVLNATASGYNTALTVGNKINAAASAGDPWTTALPGAYGAGTAGNILGSVVQNALKAAGGTAPSWFVASPTAATIATQVWEDALAGGDFGTAGSIGLLLNTDVNATVSSRSTYAGTDTAGTTTLLSRVPGTVQPQTGDSYARLGVPSGASIDADILTRLATAGYTSPTGAVVTVSATDANVAGSVLNAVASSYNTALSIGQKINSAGAAADPLLNTVPGAYGAGTAGFKIGTYLDAAISSRQSSASAVTLPANGPANFLVNMLAPSGFLNPGDVWGVTSATLTGFGINTAASYLNHAGLLTTPSNFSAMSIDSSGRLLLQPTQTFGNTGTWTGNLTGSIGSLPAAPANFLTSGAFAAGAQAPAGFLTNEYAAVAAAVGSTVVDQLTMRQVLSLQQALLLDAVRTYNGSTHTAVATWYASKITAGAVVPDTTKPVLVKTTVYDATDKQIISSSTAMTQANL
jgi:hypothetical protein